MRAPEVDSTGLAERLREVKIAQAAEDLDAKQLSDGRYAYYADETGSWWIVSAGELVEYVDDYMWSDDPIIAADAYSHWCAGASADEVDEDSPEYEEITGRVHCQSGKITGARCDAFAPRKELVTVEWMPEHLRASHEAAGNWGSYPHNGAERHLCCSVCAEAIRAGEAEAGS